MHQTPSKLILPGIFKLGLPALLAMAIAGCGGGSGGDGGGSTQAYQVSGTAEGNGSISPASATVNDGADTSFSLTPDSGYAIASVTGCGGSLDGDTYTTGTITAACTVNASFELAPPPAPTLSLTPEAIKTFQFSWDDVTGETEYTLLEDPSGNSGYTEIASIAADATSHELVVSLPKRVNARYILEACNSGGCSESAAVYVSGALEQAIGYLKASNTGVLDLFGEAIALSGDGNTLAVGAPFEDGNATGVNGTSNNFAANAGAVYVFVRNVSTWNQQAYIKASNSDTGDQFGDSVALSADGSILAIGAPSERSSTTGVNSLPNDDANASGAVYVFTRDGDSWDEQAYIKASNTDDSDFFGKNLALSGDGKTLAVGATGEDSSTTSINSTPNEDATDAGAVYVFTYRYVLSEAGLAWREQAYIKPSNTDADDKFGQSLALSGDGDTLAVGSPDEDSSSNSVNSTPDNDEANAGAAYVFTRSDFTWSQHAYVKAANNGSGDQFGGSIALSNDGNTLAVGARLEDSTISGVNGLPSDSGINTGAVYVFTRNAALWDQNAFIKASNPGNIDVFGDTLTLAGDGNTLAVGAVRESSGSTGLNSTPNDDVERAGAVYVFTLDSGTWSQQAYVKATNPGVGYDFGSDVALADDGSTLAVGSKYEKSGSTGVDSTPDETATNAGAAYLY